MLIVSNFDYLYDDEIAFNDFKIFASKYWDDFMGPARILYVLKSGKVISRFLRRCVNLSRSCFILK